MNVRRAKPADVAGINQLLQRSSQAGTDEPAAALKRRFGKHYNVAAIVYVDASPFSLVTANEDGSEIQGFYSVTSGPPSYIDDEGSSGEFVGSGATARGDWTAWIKRSYDCPDDMQIHNTTFVNFFHAESSQSSSFLDSSLLSTVQHLPHIRYICYFLPEGNALFAPFSMPRIKSSDGLTSRGAQSAKDANGRKADAKYFAEVAATNSSSAFKLFVCAAADLLPKLRVRNAKVEDADDLLPMFKKQRLINDDEADYYLSSLLESQTANVKTLVAEADGDVVGFITINRDVQEVALTHNFQLEPFDLLLKGDTSRPQSSTTFGPTTQPDGSRSHSVQQNVFNGSRPLTAASDSTMESDQQPHQEEPQGSIPNAFCIELFSMADSYASQAMELVRAAYKQFPDLDYCVVTVPTTMPEVPLFRQFARVYVKTGMSDQNALYLSNRFGVTDVVKVEKAAAEEAGSIDFLLDGVAGRDSIFSDYQTATQSQGSKANLNAFSITCARQIIGLAILETCADAKQWTDQFAIHDFVNPKLHKLEGKACMLRHFVINPLFEHESRWVFEELLRLNGTTCIMYPLQEATNEDPSTRRICAREMVPVKPRREIQFPNNIRDGTRVPAPLLCALQLISTNLLYEPKITVNSRIVIVGGSDCGTAVIEKLIYNPRFWYPNLTLISEQGAPKQPEGRPFVSSRCYSNVQLRQLGIPDYVKIVRGTVSEIDRMIKRVRMVNDSFANYDYLVLTPGLQFRAESISQEFGALEGVFSVSSFNEKQIVDGVEYALGNRGIFVVYGRHLQAYAGIQLLLENKVPGNRIALVVPPRRDPRTALDNTVLDQKVDSIVQALGVKIYKNCFVSTWENDEGLLTGVNFRKIEADGSTSLMTLSEVSLFLYADAQSVSPETFSSMNDSSLVIDGKLVIDKYFRTQDPFIYAAGKVTKYSSVYRTHWSQSLYDAKEVGHRLANELVPNFNPETKVERIDDERILRFEDAKKTLAILPGNLLYFHFDEPHLISHTHEHRKKLANYGQDLVIDKLTKPGQKGSYFRIHVDTDGIIRSMTYLGEQRIPIDNYLRLYGLHEKYLNRLVSRFNEGIIPDFVSFLSGTWALPLFYDRFPGFVNDLGQEELAEQIDTGLKVRGIIDDEHHFSLFILTTMAQLTAEDQRGLYKAFDNAPARRTLDSKVFNYLAETEIYRSYP
ncbi:uncharacterized protein EV422DRAFT_493768 [Fimicolochytrium jonesii]|uniref:uncharacterized protein n=1 Tax=Fimicolochytrium jonesii TaxID=1396493 RepID=UPI0022FDDF42|nr:uncharacterized protein EV422DRAFT_493768 [Fimicolochytrium jonesii]KAI8823503.1 hypothetical protein EV422DRAFT_493768 [Fimicolochytrium jonesii]